MFALGLEFLPDLPQIVMFGRNKGQTLSNFDDEVNDEALFLVNNTFPLASADEPIFPVSPGVEGGGMSLWLTPFFLVASLLATPPPPPHLSLKYIA